MEQVVPLRPKPRVPENAWSILPTGPPPIKVVCAQHGTPLCEVQPKASWTLDNLIREVSAATSMAGDEFRLLWAGAPLAQGALPGPLLQIGDVSFTVYAVRVNAAWLDTLDSLLEKELPEVPSIEDICAGRMGGMEKPPSLTTANRDIALAAVQHSGSMLLQCNEELLHDKEIVLAAVRECGLALRFVPEPLRSDHEVVLTAVGSDGEALKLALKEFQSDHEIVTAAIKQEGEAIRHASHELKQDKSLLLTAIRRSAKSFIYVPEVLQMDKAFVISAVRVNGDVLTYAPQGIRTNKEVRLAAKAYWAGEGDAPPHGDGWIRMAHLWKPKDTKPSAAARVA